MHIASRERDRQEIFLHHRWRDPRIERQPWQTGVSEGEGGGGSSATNSPRAPHAWRGKGKEKGDGEGKEAGEEEADEGRLPPPAPLGDAREQPHPPLTPHAQPASRRSPALRGGGFSFGARLFPQSAFVIFLFILCLLA